MSSTTKKLSTGHTITLSLQDDKMLKRVYDYVAGFERRKQLTQALEKRKANLTVAVATESQQHKNTNSNKKQYAEEDANSTDILIDNSNNIQSLKNEISKLEDKIRSHDNCEKVIKSKDIESVLRHHGTIMTRKKVEHMIWEIDEKGDGVIDWEEFQLTYFYNIYDTSGCEPCTFFHILEFLTFDESKKGYIIEDDCMEILFARYGSAKLEKELRLIFGNQLRAAGGNGTLTLNGYLISVLSRTGRRAIVF